MKNTLINKARDLRAVALGAVALASLAGCGNVDGKLKNLLQPSLDLDMAVTFTTEVDNATADNEMHNVVKVKFADDRGNVLSNFALQLSVPSGVTASCATTNSSGESRCTLKTAAAGDVTMSVANGGAALIGAKTHKVTFVKNEPKPGFNVGGVAGLYDGFEMIDTDSDGVADTVTTNKLGVIRASDEFLGPVIAFEGTVNGGAGSGNIRVLANMIGIFASKQELHEN